MKQTENLWIVKDALNEIVFIRMCESLRIVSPKMAQVAHGIILLGEMPWRGATRYVFYADLGRNIEEELDDLLGPLVSIGLHTLMIVPFESSLSAQLRQKYDRQSCVEFVNVDRLLQPPKVKTFSSFQPPEAPSVDEGPRYRASINGQAANLSRFEYEAIRFNPEEFSYLLDFCELDTRGRIRFAHKKNGNESKDFFITRDPARLFSLLLRKPNKIIEKSDMDRDLRICDLRSMFFRVRREIERPVGPRCYRHFHAYNTNTPNPGFLFEPDASTSFIVISVFSSDL